MKKRQKREAINHFRLTKEIMNKAENFNEIRISRNFNKIFNQLLLLMFKVLHIYHIIIVEESTSE